MTDKSSLTDNTIWHLSHSSNAIKIDGKLLIFDYCTAASDRPAGAGIEKGYIDCDELTNESVYVFSSHDHGDHFSRDILAWQDKIKNISYVLSFDIRPQPDGAICAEAGQEYQLDGIKVVTYPSTDEGVAFSVIVGGKHVYFAGDNAYWNWNRDKTEEWYIKEILAPIKAAGPVDIAFQVCDPRLEDRGAGGIYILARALNPNLLIPIHSFGTYGINAKAKQELTRLGFKNDFWCIEQAGQQRSF